MIPKKFDYYAAKSLDEAIQFLSENEEAKVLAGGQSLLGIMKLRLAAPTALVDISRLPDLSYIREDGDCLAIGVLTTHDTIEHSPTIKEKFTILNEAASKIGDQQTRNLGTIGGSACHADPAADLPTALRVLDAEFVIQGKKGERVVPAPDFFLDIFTTAVGHDEILTEIRLPYLPPNSASAFIRHSLREHDFAIVIAGAALTVGDGNVCENVRIGLGAAGPTPLRATYAEQYLTGKILDEATIVEAAERAVDGVNPSTDVHGSKQYRIEMIKTLTNRSLSLTLSRTGWTGGT
jgi:carbon-monoxide dehydrogenase medium subunit